MFPFERKENIPFSWKKVSVKLNLHNLKLFLSWENVQPPFFTTQKMSQKLLSSKKNHRFWSILISIANTIDANIPKESTLERQTRTVIAQNLFPFGNKYIFD